MRSKPAGGAVLPAGINQQAKGLDMYEIGLSYEATGPRGRTVAMTMARIAALQSTLGWVAPMATRPAIVQHRADGAVVAFDAKQQKPKARAKAQQVAKPAKLSAEQFYDAWMLAIKAMRADVGERWDLRASAWQWAKVPPRMTHFLTPIVRDADGVVLRGGTKMKWSAEQKYPAARYWPGGALPVGLEVSVIAAPVLTPWVPSGRVDTDGKAILVHPTLARLEAAYAEQIAANVPWRLKRAAAKALTDYTMARDSIAWSRDSMRLHGDQYRSAYESSVRRAWKARGDWHATRAEAEAVAA
ncbi:MAG TPA: hypothetical protein VHT52_12230 [Stellaceae bacterium]|jgi:hypothetical protein|nr:hypothetical protein [Stellaceae bacterium]